MSLSKSCNGLLSGKTFYWVNESAVFHNGGMTCHVHMNVKVHSGMPHGMEFDDVSTMMYHASLWPCRKITEISVFFVSKSFHMIRHVLEALQGGGAVIL